MSFIGRKSIDAVIRSAAGFVPANGTMLVS